MVPGSKDCKRRKNPFSTQQQPVMKPLHLHQNGRWRKRWFLLFPFIEMHLASSFFSVAFLIRSEHVEFYGLLWMDAASNPPLLRPLPARPRSLSVRHLSTSSWTQTKENKKVEVLASYYYIMQTFVCCRITPQPSGWWLPVASLFLGRCCVVCQQGRVRLFHFGLPKAGQLVLVIW